MSDPETSESDQPQGPIAAPSLDGAVGWLNVASPITLAQLRGKVVILDFWTYGCINCMHILRDLKTLETRFPAELVVKKDAAHGWADLGKDMTTIVDWFDKHLAKK